MKHIRKRLKNKAQTAVEYMLLLSAVVVIVITGFSRYIANSKSAAEGYFTNVSVGIFGDPPNGVELQRSSY